VNSRCLGLAGGRHRHSGSYRSPGRCSSDIIAVSGEHQPDALAVAALARTANAALVLTPAAPLRASASNCIGSCVTSNGAPLVHIVGREAAVSADVATSVDALADVSVNRISGLDRDETAAAIANTVTGPAIGSL
jgi:putative cell wall-binding protein